MLPKVPAREDPMKRLTSHELQVLLLSMQELPVKAIGQQLGICPSTVYAHRASLMEKLQARTIPALTRYLTKIGFLKSLPLP